MRLLRGAVLGAALLALPGCTSFVDGMRTSASPSGSGSGGSGGCPTERAAPDPHRPVIRYDFRLADDPKAVTGTETVTFTPDLDTDKLVFRLLPNSPVSARAGNVLTVDGARGGDVARASYVPDGAAGPGGLYEVALQAPLGAGHSTTVALDFTLILGEGTFDRFGTAAGLSWWGSGAPLLAWEPGVGWAEDPFPGLLGETASSTVADTRISVSVPETLTVLMTGNQDQPSAPQDGRRTWTSAEPVARDVSVVVGPFTTAQRTTPDGVSVTVGVLPHSDLGVEQLADWTTASIADLEKRFGPFPYRTLTVPLLPAYGGGIEYPSSIQLAASDRDVLLHEVAHMYFYGMVGDSQFRDPWLDEAFATYAESVDHPPPDAAVQRALHQPGDVGAAIAGFANDDQYFGIVYGKGGAALLAARQAAGADPFDAAIRCYVDANAWTIATPADVAAALADLPAALQVLLDAGALQQDDLSA